MFDVLSVTDNPCRRRVNFEPINWSFILLWLDGKAWAFVTVSCRAQLWTRATIVIVSHSMSQGVWIVFLIVSFLVNMFVFSQCRGKLIYSWRYVIITASFCLVCTYSSYFLFAILKRSRNFWISNRLCCVLSLRACISSFSVLFFRNGRVGGFWFISSSCFVSVCASPSIGDGFWRNLEWTVCRCRTPRCAFLAMSNYIVGDAQTRWSMTVSPLI